jgi:hypothetical protein
MKRLLKCMLMVCIFFLVARFCRKQTAEFTMSAVASDLPFDPAWETRPILDQEKSEVKKILQQKFTFLGNGGQCFVFASDDGKYVLKLFKIYRRRLYAPLNLLLSFSWLEPYRQKKIAAKRLKLVRDFGSHVLAFNELQEETALVYVHLNKTNDLQQKLILVDKLGIKHTIDLDKYEFVIQKRATLVYETLNRLMKDGKQEEAKKRIDDLVDLVIRRSQKGIYDEDAFISRNFGFIDDKPIIIDAGRLRKVPSQSQPAVYKADLLLTTDRFRLWLEQNHPILTPHLLEKRNAIQ